MKRNTDNCKVVHILISKQQNKKYLLALILLIVIIAMFSVSIVLTINSNQHKLFGQKANSSNIVHINKLDNTVPTTEKETYDIQQETTYESNYTIEQNDSDSSGNRVTNIIVDGTIPATEPIQEEYFYNVINNYSDNTTIYDNGICAVRYDSTIYITTDNGTTITALDNISDSSKPFYMSKGIVSFRDVDGKGYSYDIENKTIKNYLPDEPLPNQLAAIDGIVYNYYVSNNTIYQQRLFNGDTATLLSDENLLDTITVVGKYLFYYIDDPVVAAYEDESISSLSKRLYRLNLETGENISLFYTHNILSLEAYNDENVYFAEKETNILRHRYSYDRYEDGTINYLYKNVFSPCYMITDKGTYCNLLTSNTMYAYCDFTLSKSYEKNNLVFGSWGVGSFSTPDSSTTAYTLGLFDLKNYSNKSAIIKEPENAGTKFEKHYNIVAYKNFYNYSIYGGTDDLSILILKSDSYYDSYFKEYMINNIITNKSNLSAVDEDKKEYIINNFSTRKSTLCTIDESKSERIVYINDGYIYTSAMVDGECVFNKIKE